MGCTATNQLGRGPRSASASASAVAVEAAPPVNPGAQRAILSSSPSVLDLKATILSAALVNAGSIKYGHADLSLSGLDDEEGSFQAEPRHAQRSVVARFLEKVFVPTKYNLHLLRAVPIQTDKGRKLIDCKKVRRALNAVPPVATFEASFQPDGLFHWPPELTDLVNSQKALKWVDELDHGDIRPMSIDALGLQLDMGAGVAPLDVTSATFPGIKLFRRMIPESEKREYAAEVQQNKLNQLVLVHGTYLGNWDSILRTGLEPRDAVHGHSMDDGIYGATVPGIAIAFCRVDEYKDIPNILPRSWVRDTRWESKLGQNPYIIGVFKACVDNQHDRDSQNTDGEIWVARNRRRAMLGFLVSINHPQYWWSRLPENERSAVEKIVRHLQDNFGTI